MKKEELNYWLDYVIENLPSIFDPMKEMYEDTTSKKDWEVIFFIANSLSSKWLNKYDEGLEIFEYLLQNHMKDNDYTSEDLSITYKIWAYEQMAQLYANKNDYNKSLECINKAIEIDQNDHLFSFGVLDFISDENNILRENLMRQIDSSI